MFLYQHQEYFQLTDRIVANIDYAASEPNGRLVIDAVFSDLRTATVELALDPWSGAGYYVQEWKPGGVLAICGLRRIVFLSTDTLECTASLSREIGEYEHVDCPWFAQNDESFIIASPTRLFCMDRRQAISWCWTVRARTSEWLEIASTPSLVDRRLVVPIKMREYEDVITFDEFGLVR